MAVGKDQAQAAAKYLKEVEEINKATAAQMTKFAPGESKKDLTDAAEQRFREALSNSAAAKADDTYRAALIRLGLTSEQSTGKLKELNDAIKKRADANGGVEPADAAQSRRLAALADAADLAKKSMEAVKPIFDEQYKHADETTKKVQPYGLTGAQQTAQERVRQEAVVAQAEAATVQKIRDLQAAADLANSLQRPEHEREADAKILSARVQAAQKMAEAEAKVDEQSQQERAARVQAASSEVEGAFKDLIFGAKVSDISKKLTTDLMQGIYDELIGNPLKGLIQTALNGLFQPGQTGPVGSSLSWLGQVLGLSGSSTASGIPGLLSSFGSLSSASGNGALADSDAVFASAGLAKGGMIPGFAGGSRAPSGRLSGSGTGTSDSILALAGGGRPIRVSAGEMIMTAKAASTYGPTLEAMNRAPGFARGGYPNGGGGMGGGSVTVNDYRTGRDPAPQIKRSANGDTSIDLRSTSRQMIRSNPDAVRDAAMDAGPKVIRRGG